MSKIVKISLKKAKIANIKLNPANTMFAGVPITSPEALVANGIAEPYNTPIIKNPKARTGHITALFLTDDM